MALTELAIKHLKPKPKPYRIADGGGLCLEVSTAGGKLWRWRYYYQGKEQMLALGKYPALSLAEARKKRDSARDLLDAGKHPSREKKAQKLRKAHEGANTFEKIARKWLETKEEGLNEKYSKQCLVRMEQHVFPQIGDLPLTEITIPDVVEVVEKIGKRGTIETAKRMKQLIGQVFRYASQRGLCVHNPAADLRDLLPSPQEKHHACIHPSELPELISKIEAREKDYTYYAMKLLMLTFVRTGELIGAKWEEINWDKEEWHIPAERMKMKRPHVVPLSRQTHAILKEMLAITGDKKYIFHSPASKSMHISNGTVLMGLRRMGYKNKMTGHGFRTLASTILNEKNYPPDVIERQLAHEDGDKIRAAYNRAEYLLERKKMMQEYADYLDNIQKKVGKNVTQTTFRKIGNYA
jgi:integrase